MSENCDDLTTACSSPKSSSTSKKKTSSQKHHLDNNIKNPKKIFVGGIGQKTTEASMRRHFTQFGDVQDCVLITQKKTHKSRGFGFITYPSQETVEIVVKGRHKIDDVLVECRRALPKAEAKTTAMYDTVYMPSKVFVGGIPESMDETKFRDFFSSFGEVIDAVLAYDKATHRPRGFGFITFEESESVEAAVGKHDYLGKQIEAKASIPRDANAEKTKHSKSKSIVKSDSIQSKDTSKSSEPETTRTLETRPSSSLEDVSPLQGVPLLCEPEVPTMTHPFTVIETPPQQQQQQQINTANYIPVFSAPNFFSSNGQHFLASPSLQVVVSPVIGYSPSHGGFAIVDSPASSFALPAQHLGLSGEVIQGPKPDERMGGLPGMPSMPPLQIPELRGMTGPDLSPRIFPFAGSSSPIWSPVLTPEVSPRFMGSPRCGGNLPRVSDGHFLSLPE